MIVFLLNMVLAVVWALLIGSIDLPNLFVGFLLGYGVLWLSQPLLGGTKYFRRGPQLVLFLAFFVKELIVSNMVVALEVLTPTRLRRPGVVAIPLDAKTDAEITFLANVVTLTPGTLSLDVSEDRSMLYVHTMFLESPEALRKSIKDGFERRILELMR
jgi:multicomponent Na+:H+ antiporter subunit E